MSSTPLIFPDLVLIAQGKVRDIYSIPNSPEYILFIATDRLSAFDVVLLTDIPNKGKILNQLSLFWFKLLKEHGVINHLITSDINEMPLSVQKYKKELDGRCMLVKRLTMLPVEAIVRGYISGSGWKEYKKSSTICDIKLPEGLVESEKLPTILFTPSTKADLGIHDENISPEKAASIIGPKYNELETLAIKCYKVAADYALTRGIIIADTKFEFGVLNDMMILGDEVLTPDSSRFWPADKYEKGRSQDSYDKQYVRDYLESIHFDKQTPVSLPEDVVTKTLYKYIEIYKIITGEDPLL